MIQIWKNHGPTSILCDDPLPIESTTQYLHTVQVLGLVTSLAKHAALKDGKISLSERRVLWILGVTSSAIVICDVVVIIWVRTPIYNANNLYLH